MLKKLLQSLWQQLDLASIAFADRSLAKFISKYSTCVSMTL